MRKRWFWLFNLALILLYLWTLTEQSTVRVQVEGGACTAVLAEDQDVTFKSTISCPQLSGGFSGLYLRTAAGSDLSDKGPLDWLAPTPGWRSIAVITPESEGRQLAISLEQEVPGWRRVWGEWRPLGETGVMRWKTQIDGDYEIAAELRRPAGEAGLLLLQANGESGWIFLVEPNRRRGTWWQWQDGQIGDPIVGIPFQKSLLAQGQSLLRRVLRAHQGALLLLLAGWLMITLSSRARRLKPGLLDGLGAPGFWTIRPEYYTFAVLIIALLTLTAAAAIASWILERLPHVQDSITYLFQAQLLARGRIWAEAPPLPEFFAQEFLIVDDGRWFGQYPPGYPLLLAAGVVLGQPWLVNPVLGAAAILLLYLLGRVLYTRSTGLIAILLACTSPFVLFMSGSFMAHPAELLWVTLFMLSWSLALQSAQRRWPLLAGLALGMIVLTRQATAAGGALPFMIVMGVGQWAGGRQRRALAGKVGLLLAAALPLAAVLLLYQYTLTGNPLEEPRLLARPFDRIGFGSEIGERNNAFQLEIVDGLLQVNWYYDEQQAPRGHTPARGVYNAEQNWRSLEKLLFGWPPLLTLAFVWLLFLRGRPSKADWALLATVGSTVFLYVFYWANGIMYGPRYYYAALPALLLLTARGIQATAQWLGRDGRLAMAVLLTALIAGNLIFVLPRYLDAYRGYNLVSGEDRAMVEQAIREPALVFVESNPLNWWEYGRFFSGNTPWLDSRIIYARDLGPAQNKKLRELYPERAAYYWMSKEGLKTAE